jgi:signal transduction histidine kinase
MVRLWVDDEGPGVPAGERERIWRAFHRGSTAEASAQGGSGIGLAVVRDLVLQAGGTVAIDSAPGGGARFVAELPAAAEPSLRPLPSS